MNTEAAALIATLLPIGVLILAFESRGVAEGTKVRGTVLANFLAAIPAAATFVGVVGTFVAAAVVISGGNAEPFWNGVILFAGIAVYSIAGAIAIYRTFKNFRDGVTTK